ncbi:YheC/YheD family protein [Paenibacillus lemnae]|uniref:YheC/YheD family protein n=1 Tax=Paenibacillus lemnae TaxID=1330551 RepID=UPI001FE3CB48|nr:YheC/YheD family protein [Paenibacillus lemnae]
MANKPLGGKMNKTTLMRGNRMLASHIPQTRRLKRSVFYNMLHRYGMVYVKPDRGSQGKGVIRVERLRRGYRYQYGTGVHTFRNFNRLYRSLSRYFSLRPYLVQRGIHVLRYNGRPFDFRVMIQRNPSRRWECTGTFGRLAHPRKAVTNGSQGGTIYAPSVLLRPFAGRRWTPRLLRNMNRMAHVTAARLSARKSSLNELGLDICFDRRLKPWILEVNTVPDPKPFMLLSNRRIIRKIVAYGRAYGRHYNLKVTKARRA